MKLRQSADVGDHISISRCLAGDSESLSLLYNEYHELLLGVAQRYVANAEVARDVEHDSWVMILTSMASLHDTANLKNWMCRIVRNTALNYLKHERVLREVPIEHAEGVGQEAADEFLPPPLPVMMDMVNQLPQGYEQVFRLHIFEGLTHEQIGKMLGIAASTSRSQLSHARDMLQQMLHRYWALLVAALLVPIAALLLMNRQKSDSTELAGPVTTTRRDVPHPVLEPEEVTHDSVTPAASAMAHGVAATSIAQSDVVQNIDNTIQSDSPPTMRPVVSDVARLPQLSLPVRAVMPPGTIAWHRTTAPSRHKPWQVNFAYGGNGGMTSTFTDNFLTMVNFAEGETERGTRLYTWGDYFRYVDDNASLMDSVDASRMTAIAARRRSSEWPTGDETDSYQDRTPLSETKHHERPRTIQLSLSVPLTQRWSLNSGLGYTWMKSTFEGDNGNANDITRRTQRLYYVNVPLGATYTIWQRNRLSVYASGSLRLDIPVRGRETTEWVYIGPFEHAPGDSLVFPSTHAKVKAPWQWSVGAGVGVQYQLLPHVKAYFEPGFRYYIPTGSPVETYRTEHPFDVAFPFGIRFTP